MLDGLVVNWKFFLFFLGLIGKDVILYLKEHPVDKIEDTAFLKREDVPKIPSNPGNSGFSIVECMILLAVASLIYAAVTHWK